MGRNPVVEMDKDRYRPTKEEEILREKYTPVYESQEFIPPDTLSEKELEVWNWLVKVFRETRSCMVSDSDVHLMELYCRAKVAADEAHEALKKDNSPYIIVATGKDKEGNIKTTAKANPNIKKERDNAMLCLKFFDQLGLSPLARAKAGVKAANAKKEENRWAELMDRTDED